MLSDKEFAGFHDGNFKSHFEKYIKFKRGKGEKVGHSTLIRLKTLNNELNQSCSILEIDRCTAEYILREKAEESPASRGLRISDLRQFTSFLRGCGINAAQIPNKYAKQVHSPFRPYIFSESELFVLTETADKYEFNVHRTARYPVYPVIVRILIGTGMRIGELLALRVQDVENGVFSIHCAKNNVSRYVPMSVSLSSIVDRYLADIPHGNQPQQYLFVSQYTGTGYSYDAMKYMLKKLYALAGIKTPQGNLPRIHDVRHSFCTMSLNRMLSSGMSLYVAIPILAAYVGHVNLRDTQRYIHLSEHGFDGFIQDENEIRALIPKVTGYEK